MKCRKLITCLCTSLLLLGCQDKNIPEAKSEARLWTTYATAKVIQSANRNADFVDLGTSLKVSMMREEYESGQFQITSKLREKVTLEYDDLKCGEKVFPKEKMSVYFQKYIRLPKNEHSTTKQFFTSGEFIPDMLLPYNIAVEANENYVEADSNQGITIDFDSYGVEAGLYTGNIKVHVGEMSFDVPVEVNVWDIAYEGKSTFQTCWLIYNDELFVGELDSTDEMMDTYADFLCKYKANPYIKVGQITPEEFVEDVERMWNIRNYNSVVIPCSFVAGYKPSPGCEEVEFIKAIVRASNKVEPNATFDNDAYFTNPNNYTKYAVTYMGAYDEADLNKEANDAGVKEFFRDGGGYSQLVEMVIDELTDEGFFLDKSTAVASDIKNDIRNIPCVFTNNAGVQTDWVGKLNATFCPIENLLSKPLNVERYIDGARLSNNKYWNYTCCNPYYPYPSHHIDDDNLSMRVLGWMDKAYSCTGYLYYEANMNSAHVGEGIYIDPYETAIRNVSVSGDGFIMYPGLKYGSSTPFPSNRLITYRDGLEDFDMLEIYENLLKENAAKYGINKLDTKIYVQDLYDEIFENAVSYEDHSLVFKVREILAERILNLKNSSEDLFYRYVSEGEVNKLQVFANTSMAYEGSTRIPAKQVEGFSNKYYYDFVLNNNAKEINISLGSNLKKYTIQAYGLKNIFNASDSSNISTNDESNTFLNGESLIANIVCEYKDEDEYVGSKTKNFYPSIKFSNVNIDNASYINMNYSNLTPNADIDFEIVFTNSFGMKTVIGSHFCSVGLTKSGLFKVKESKNLKGIGTLEIRFANYTFDNGAAVLYPERNVGINSLQIYY